MPGDLSAVAPAAAGYRALLDLLWRDAEMAMLVIDSDHRIRQANPVAVAALGCRGLQGARLSDLADEITSLDGTIVHAPGQWPADCAMRGETITRELVSVRRGTAEPRRVLVSAQPIALDDGSAGALVSFHDVTDSWQYAERTRTELARLGQLLEGASDYAIILLDPAGLVQSWSPAAELIQGYTEQEAIGLPYASFFDDGDQAIGLPKQILTKAAGRGKAEVEGKRLRRDGSVFWAHAVLTAIRDEDGTLQGFVKVTHDASERRAIERATIELNELLEERVTERTVQLEQQAADLAAVNSELEAFSYSVSHDLRAPLRAMNGFARIMEDEFGDQLPPEAMHYLNKVTDNARQMGQLIDALLSFSRIQRQSMRSAPIDMTELVQECWTSLAWARVDREVEFVLPQLPCALGDRRLIQQVWVNLLDNAIKYTVRGGVARVEVAGQIQRGGDPGGGFQLGPVSPGWVGDGGVPDEVDGTVLYTVRDNGVGFDMQYVNKIGQVFQRLHHAADFPGTGIGLALVQRIVQRHGGRLSAVGEAEVGATFGFTLRATP